MTSSERYMVRAAAEEDLPAVAKIHRHYVLNTVRPQPALPPAPLARVANETYLPRS
jgi:L-amino acid N-acyltransferase YncA